MLRNWRKLVPRPNSNDPLPTFDRYVSAPPALQNAVDALRGWSCALPPKYGVQTGSLATYQDARIQWAIDRLGSLEGRRVLELGPLEGGHTIMLEGAGASVDAIEADKLAFMRCLITKEIVGLIRAKFWLGDFVKWLENKDKNYDLIVASEVLHHVTDPLRVIELISRRTEAVYIWTHVVTEATMHRDDPNGALMQNTEKHDFHGMKVRIYRGNDSPADDNAACGGIRSDIRRWLHRDDLLEALKILGFQTVQTAHNEQSHLHGRTLSIFAHK